MIRATAFLGWVFVSALAASAPVRTTFLVPVDAEPSWRDLAFLAAVPASEAANPGGGSLIALPPGGTVGPEILDYAARYRADRLVLLGDSGGLAALKTGWPGSPAPWSAIPAGNAEEAALRLSRQFFRSSPIVVVVRPQNFEAALTGAALASLVKAPLLYSGQTTLSGAVATELKRLGAKRVLAVGGSAPRWSGPVTPLPTSDSVLAWARESKLRVSYLAAVNPQDRGRFVTRKLSMVGAQLAAGRGGLVVPLNLATQWKRPFATTPFKGSWPAHLPQSAAKPFAGSLAFGADKVPFLLGGDDDDHGLRLAIDRSGDGRFAETLVNGDTISLGGRTWTVSLGQRTKFGATRVHLTWPTAAEIKTRLESAYRALGAPPEHLCLVGFPDALPHAILGKGGVVEEQTSDLPFAMVGEADFAQIGVARVVAENLSFGTLYAARALTYPDLIQPQWAQNAAMAEWENSLGFLFENVGFGTPHHLTADQVPWTVPPAEGQEGQRAASFGPSSPLASCAVLAHSEHSWWQSLGSTFRWDATVLMAPTVVESGGCATATLDRDPQNRSVVARLLRLGAVGFAGGSREHSAEAQPLRMAFWNGVLSGETLGQAHRRAWNAGLLVVRNQGEGPRGGYRYNTQIRMQFGDPALRLRLPSAPRVAPARTALAGDRVTVHAPGQWRVVKTVVPPDWKQWAGRDLYAVRGPGAFAMSSWSGVGRDKEILLVKAEFTTARPVKAIVALDSVPAPLGWNGKWYSSRNFDGTYTHRFSVRMVDFDEERGQILRTVERLDFRVEFE